MKLPTRITLSVIAGTLLVATSGYSQRGDFAEFDEMRKLRGEFDAAATEVSTPEQLDVARATVVRMVAVTEAFCRKLEGQLSPDAAAKLRASQEAWSNYRALNSVFNRTIGDIGLYAGEARTGVMKGLACHCDRAVVDKRFHMLADFRYLIQSEKREEFTLGIAPPQFKTMEWMSGNTGFRLEDFIPNEWLSAVANELPTWQDAISSSLSEVNIGLNGHVGKFSKGLRGDGKVEFSRAHTAWNAYRELDIEATKSIWAEINPTQAPAKVGAIMEFRLTADRFGEIGTLSVVGYEFSRGQLFSDQ